MPYKMKLEFLPNVGDEDEGLGDAGIETFRDSPFASVARESGQNSRDAAVAFPVMMSFDLISFPTSELPDIERFRAAVSVCDKRAREGKDLKEKQFFEKAKRLLSSERLFALRVADESTTGLVGPCVAGTPFHSLVKASGVSNKNDVTSGGSFGIGKKAAFAVSDLHTVFYSTRYAEGVETRFLAQGKCTLVSHLALDGSANRATGYWGNDNFLPVSTPESCPDWLDRESIGTTTTAIGFSAFSDWKFKIAESLVRNFFAAIHRNELNFSVDNSKIDITPQTLAKVFALGTIQLAAEEHGTTEDLAFSRTLYECLTSDQTKSFAIDVEHLGAFQMHLLVREGLPKRVAFIRNGMFITDNLGSFGDKLAHFPMYKDFVAIVEPTSDQSKAYIKRLENPRHDQLSAERLILEAEQRVVKAAMKVLKNWIRDSIRSEAFVPPAEEIRLDEMNEFFGDVSKIDRIVDPQGEPDPLQITYTPTKRKRLKQVKGAVQGEEGEGGAGGTNTGSGGTKTGPGSGLGQSEGGSGGSFDIGLLEVRNYPDPDNPTLRRIVNFTPVNSGSGRLRVQVKGMSEDVPVKEAIFRDGKGVPFQEIHLKAGQRTTVGVEFPYHYSGPIEIGVVGAVAEEAPSESQ